MGIWWWRLILVSLAGILFSPKHGASQRGMKYTFMKNASSAPSVSYYEYEYIVIGGGTAGCPLAATLSEKHKVLVLERGPSPYGNPNITNLDAFGAALSDTSPNSPSQRFISQDGVINSRARVLGGGSCLNAGFYTRASPYYVREAGWDGKLVKKSYEWVERVVAFEPIVRQWQSAVRGGLLEVGVLPYNGFTFDHIRGTKVGGTIFDQHGHRHTAADLLEYANPTQLTVLLQATVSKILFTNKGSRSRPVASGVIFMDALGREHRVYLKQGPKSEIIVSAGALGSPQLLMLSGIGAERELRKHNIDVVLNQPLVGQGMSDNPMNAIFVPSPVPVEVSLIEVVGITNVGSYIEAASGQMFTSRSPRDYGMFSPKIGQFSKLPPKQRSPEAVAKAIEKMGMLEPAAFRGGFILEKIMGPISTGELQLETSDPNDNPSVSFNYFKDPRDLKRCVQGIRTIEKVIESKAFSRFRYHNMSASVLLNMTANSPVNLLPKHSNTATSLEQFCRDTVMTIWHYHGGCQVGRVVDARYKVIGVDALRVIDGSTFNCSPGTNPQATVMMLGRYMGVKILRERLAGAETE
ncbi:Protein HOTHEAD [Glycine max]|uniref:protein HOTHEAD-like isoform X2 n=1 Tax=Glycine soja TaxID=3848 RepID=UPI00103C2651|nr:protein HOTHEAD-like isoform X2 [Glycine soja]KAH1223401.1 Protein HOTHEAD [Glycine max]